jgi:prephenate dehydrogenase
MERGGQLARITILGLGLIGGSMGLALKRSRLKDIEIAGYDAERGVANKAQRMGAIDRAAPDAEAAVREAAIVVIATPISAMREVMTEIAGALPDNCIVTDTASTKALVLQWAADLLPPRVSFVGGHPMAGKEQSGIDGAEAGLFEGRAYCIVPSVSAGEPAVNSVVGLAELAGAIPVYLDAEEHDSYAAAVSHLPVVTSAALFSLVRESPAWPEMSQVASSGFRDATRLASTNPELTDDILHTNREQVVHWLDRMMQEVARLRDLIEKGDEEEIFKAFARIRLERDTYITTGAKRREEKAAVPDAGVSISDLLVGEWAGRRTREIMKSLEQQERRAQERRPRKK